MSCHRYLYDDYDQDSQPTRVQLVPSPMYSLKEYEGNIHSSNENQILYNSMVFLCRLFTAVFAGSSFCRLN